MEISAANVARNKMFYGKPGSQVSSTEKVDTKKFKIGELATEEIQEIKDNAVPVTTKKP